MPDLSASANGAGGMITLEHQRNHALMVHNGLHTPKRCHVSPIQKRIVPGGSRAMRLEPPGNFTIPTHTLSVSTEPLNRNLRHSDPDQWCCMSPMQGLLQ